MCINRSFILAVQTQKVCDERVLVCVCWGWGQYTSLSASSPAAHGPPLRNITRCGLSPCAGQLQQSWPGTDRWRCWWALWGKDGGGRIVLMSWGCETGLNTSTIVCQAPPAPPSEAHNPPKWLPRRVSGSPAARKDDHVPKAQSDQCKWKKSSEGDEECSTIKTVAKSNTPSVTSVTMGLTIRYRKFRVGHKGSRNVTFQQQDHERE